MEVSSQTFIAYRKYIGILYFTRLEISISNYWLLLLLSFIYLNELFVSINHTYFFVCRNLQWFKIVEYFTTKFLNFFSIFFIYLFLTQFYSIYNNNDNNNANNNDNNDNNNNEKATCNG